MIRKQSGLGKFVLAASLLGILTACGKDSVETRRETPRPGTTVSALDAAMLAAAAKGDNARVKELLDKGVNVNMLGPNRNTPIMEAAFAGHLDTVKLLLDHGADLSARKDDGATPMTLAPHREIIDLFKNVNALVDAASKGNNQLVKALIEKGAPLNGLDQFGHSALTESCFNGKTETVKLLLESGADPKIKKMDGATPLSLASGQKHQDIVQLINEAIAKKSQPATPAPGK